MLNSSKYPVVNKSRKTVQWFGGGWHSLIPYTLTEKQAACQIIYKPLSWVNFETKSESTLSNSKGRERTLSAFPGSTPSTCNLLESWLFLKMWDLFMMMKVYTFRPLPCQFCATNFWNECCCCLLFRHWVILCAELLPAGCVSPKWQKPRVRSVNNYNPTA